MPALKVDVALRGDIRDAGRIAEQAELTGYDALWSHEADHDPFLPLALAAQGTERIQLGTGVAIAFARNPLTLATLAWDLNALSGGRFLLGSARRSRRTSPGASAWSGRAPPTA